MTKVTSPLAGSKTNHMRKTTTSAVRVDFDSRESLTALWKGVPSNFDG